MLHNIKVPRKLCKSASYSPLELSSLTACGKKLRLSPLAWNPAPRALNVVGLGHTTPSSTASLPAAGLLPIALDSPAVTGQTVMVQLRLTERGMCNQCDGQCCRRAAGPWAGVGARHASICNCCFREAGERNLAFACGFQSWQYISEFHDRLPG